MTGFNLQSKFEDLEIEVHFRLNQKSKKQSYKQETQPNESLYIEVFKEMVSGGESNQYPSSSCFEFMEATSVLSSKKTLFLWHKQI